MFCSACSRSKPLLVYEFVIVQVPQNPTHLLALDSIAWLKMLVLRPLPDEHRVFQRLAGCVSDLHCLVWP
jgi:hypothetical protein